MYGQKLYLMQQEKDFFQQSAYAKQSLGQSSSGSDLGRRSQWKEVALEGNLEEKVLQCAGFRREEEKEGRGGRRKGKAGREDGVAGKYLMG